MSISSYDSERSAAIVNRLRTLSPDQSRYPVPSVGHGSGSARRSRDVRDRARRRFVSLRYRRLLAAWSLDRVHNTVRVPICPYPYFSQAASSCVSGALSTAGTWRTCHEMRMLRASERLGVLRAPRVDAT
eukprot:scaffold20566_cov135-Isochrysis_galbana.AAC.8